MKQTLYCEVMDNSILREQGLQYVLSLPWDRGAFFIFEHKSESGFWMKNTPNPLELIFLDEHYKVISIHELRPHDTTITTCEQPFKYALEVNSGWCEAYNISPACTITDHVDLVFIKK
jgi:uncharacterized membrane protein (UPF0127 family)